MLHPVSSLAEGIPGCPRESMRPSFRHFSELPMVPPPLPSLPPAPPAPPLHPACAGRGSGNESRARCQNETPKIFDDLASWKTIISQLTEVCSSRHASTPRWNQFRSERQATLSLCSRIEAIGALFLAPSPRGRAEPAPFVNMGGAAHPRGIICSISPHTYLYLIIICDTIAKPPQNSTIRS